MHLFGGKFAIFGGNKHQIQLFRLKIPPLLFFPTPSPPLTIIRQNIHLRLLDFLPVSAATIKLYLTFIENSVDNFFISNPPHKAYNLDVS